MEFGKARKKGNERRQPLRRNLKTALGLGFLFSLTCLTPCQAQDTSVASDHAGGNQQDTAAPAQLPNHAGGFGLGLNVGNELTGITAKVWAAPSVAFQAAVGEGTQGNDLRCHIDLLFSIGTWASADGHYLLPVYLGVGGVLNHDFAAGQYPSDTEGGFRVPLGMSVLVRGNPVELFFEMAPELTVRSDSALRGRIGFYADGAIGARYYF